MFVKKNRAVILALLALLLLIIIPASFGQDNGTEMLVYEAANATEVVSVPLDEDTLGAGEIYFNASAESDGDGSQNSPYKYLNASRIQNNCNLYLANGQYQLDTKKDIGQVNIIGCDVDKTIIRYDGVAFNVNTLLTVKNVTFIGASITNNAKFNATNTIFEDGYGSKPDYYGNNYGGAIYSNGGTNSYVNVDNCTFKNNYAIYGGAIFMGSGNLIVSNSLFYDNYAYNYGGAIACEYISNITISKSKFYNSKSLNDAGGSIYIKKSSKFNADHVDVVNSSSTFGGAITTLNTTVSLSYVNMADNSAKYDGGAIFHMYGVFSLTYSEFKNNSAVSGGALFIDNSTSVTVRSNTFTNNKATSTGGAIYSLLNKLVYPYYPPQNRYTSNEAAYYKDYYDTSTLDLTIGSGNYTMYAVNATSITSLPSKYDLREEGYVTSVKDQQTSGNCWAFTAIAVLESCISKANGGLLDLSEENMKNIIALYSDYGWNRIDTNKGGYDNMPWGYLASWLGPVNEMDDLFDDRSTLSPVLNSIMHVQNIKFLQRSNFTDNDEIKRAILNYGAVGAAIYQNSYYLNSATNAYWCWVDKTCDHAVTIVGWDDNFSKDNFKFGSTSVEGNGAWIVKNSWDDSWGDNGYYYVSYYDVNFAKGEDCPYTVILNDTIRFDKNYQYDIAGMTDYFLISSPNIWYKNVFTATSDEYLAAVSTYFQTACNWTASVLVNGELKDVLSGITDSGYYTFNLNKYISLKAGDVFEAIFNVTVDGGASFPVSEVVSLNKLAYGPQTSYVSFDGKNWNDLYNMSWAYSSHTYNSQAACIKAFTYLNPINTLINLSVVFTEDCPLNISAIVKDEYGNLVKYGNVTFNINGENQSVGVVNGKASILYDYNQRINTISTTFNAEGYSSSSNSTTFTVKISIAASDLNMTYKDGSAFEVQLVDQYGNPFAKANEAIDITIDGRTYTRLTNASGVAKVTINLRAGIYPVTAQYGNTIVNNVVTVNKLSIVASDVNMTYKDGSAYMVQLVDQYGNPFAKANEAVNITIDGRTYTRLTNASGVAKVTINLGVGTYPVSAQYGNTIVENVVTVNKLSIVGYDVNMIYKDGSAYMVQLVDQYGNPYAKANEAVNITIKGKTYTRLTNESGVAKVTINLGAGIYPVTAQYGNTIVNNVVTVKYAIIASDVNMTYKDGSAYMVQLVDANGNPIDKANEAINITIDGRTYTRYTNASGVAKVTINLRAGEYLVTAQYGNTIINNVVTVNNKLSIVASDLNMSYRDGSAFEVQLVDSYGNPFAKANEAISITVAGRTYTRLTNESGVAKITINLGAGTYPVITEYNNKTINNTITVNKT